MYVMQSPVQPGIAKDGPLQRIRTEQIVRYVSMYDSKGGRGYIRGRGASQEWEELTVYD